ncbi:hypothetical protein [Paraburkholderia sp. RL17-381-BIF-C]|uniref:hypothetical protein n=1 Tax=Paraburkholderia sp. RL17-381-BIF-C TaxID=3031635 RepID=UPI0038B74A70
MKKLPSFKGRAAPVIEIAAAPVTEPVSAPVTNGAGERAEPVGSGKYTGLLTLLIRERSALLEMVGPEEEFAQAKAVAVQRGCTIDESLRERLADVRGQREAAWSAQRVLRAKQADQMSKAGTEVHAAIEERLRLGEVVRGLKTRISNFDAARRAFIGKLVDAGMSLEEASSVEPKPSADDLAGWCAQLDDALARDAELAARLRIGATAFLSEAA